MIETKTAYSPHTNSKLPFPNYSYKTMEGVYYRDVGLYLSLNVFMLIGIANMSIIIASLIRNSVADRNIFYPLRDFYISGFFAWFSSTKHYCWTQCIVFTLCWNDHTVYCLKWNRFNKIKLSESPLPKPLIVPLKCFSK